MCSKYYVYTMLHEYCDDTLFGLMRERKRYSNRPFTHFFSEAELWNFLTQILKGVDALKEHDFEYPDIQPINVLVRTNEYFSDPGGRYLLKVLDTRFFQRGE